MEAPVLKWRVHLPNLLKEINDMNATSNPLKQPIHILRDILIGLAERCSHLNDPVLNAHMCRLALYEVSDPESAEFDKSIVKKILEDSEVFKDKVELTVGRFYILKHGCDCDGMASFGCYPFLFEKEAKEALEECVEWSDGCSFELTSDIKVVHDYCYEWSKLIPMIEYTPSEGVAKINI